MDVVGNLDQESIDEQLAKVNILDGELVVVVEGSSREVPKIRKVQVPKSRGWKKKGKEMLVVFRIDDLFSKSLVLAHSYKSQRSVTYSLHGSDVRFCVESRHVAFSICK